MDSVLQFDSDLDDDDMASDAVADPITQMPTNEELSKEFDECLKRYKVACRRLPWRKMYPDKWKKNQDGEMSSPKFPIDFWDVDMKPVFESLNQENRREKPPFGYLPTMAIASKGSIGALLASSFCERINSAANQVVTSGNTFLGPDEINMLVTLRMNRDFMAFMRKHYGTVPNNVSGATRANPVTIT